MGRFGDFFERGGAQMAWRLVADLGATAGNDRGGMGRRWLGMLENRRWALTSGSDLGR